MIPGDSAYEQFETTHWSIVLEAKTGQQPTGDWQTSLESLCSAYWFPLYAYLRRKGYPPEDCQDLVQGFFGALIEKDFLKVVEPAKGRFRWFLMDAISKFAASWNAAKSAKKRGGDHKIVSIDVSDGESRYGLEPADEQSPERIFERQWALSVIEQAVNQLQQSYFDEGKQRLFEALKGFLTPGGDNPSYLSVAEKLSVSETAIKVGIHRLRQKFQKTLRQIVLQTLDDPAELDAEVDSLLQALS